MSGLAIIANSTLDEARANDVVGSLNRSGVLQTESAQVGRHRVAVAYPGNAPQATARLANVDQYCCLLAGDYLDPSPIPWSSIVEAVVTGDTGSPSLQRLQGAFLIVICDPEAQVAWVITDAYGFQPAYLYQGDNDFIVSTSIATFPRARPGTWAIDEQWLFEYLYCNYTVSGRTVFSDVHRLPPGTISQFDLRSGKRVDHRYVPLLSSSPKNLSRDDELQAAIDCFREVVPEWFATEKRSLMGLSGGLDSRAVLAAVPEPMLEKLDAFTYGISGSTEVTDAALITGHLGIPHEAYQLGESFLEELTDLLYETVYQSDALQVINRSQLPRVYGDIALSHPDANFMVTGVSGDHLFRDHLSAWGNVPYLISAEVAAMHRGGRSDVDGRALGQVFTDSFGETVDRAAQALDAIEHAYGSFGDPEAYFRFLMYVAGPLYFGGQYVIANQHTTFRTPYWDRRLVQFSMDIALGTVGLSRMSNEKDKYTETLLQAAVVCSNKKLAQVPYLDLPIDVYGGFVKARYYAYRLKRRIGIALGRGIRIQEENWPLWYRTVLADEVGVLLGPESRLKQYVRDEFVVQKQNANDIHWLGKLLTAEIILRFAENGWKKPNR